MNNRFYRWFKSRHLARNSVDTRYALLEACLIGIFSAIAALLVKRGIGWLGTLRIQSIEHFGVHTTLPIVGLTFGILAGWLIENFAPGAGGGGIPQVKAVLARYPIVLNLKVGFIKALGTIFILGAGLPLGSRGPIVNIGASLAAQLSSWIPNSPANRRQMIAAGAAAGLAAGFNAPIAGVMFVVEELMKDVSSLTLETAILASFTGSVVSRLLGSADLNIPPTILNSSSQSNFTVPEIPFYLLLGLLAGILGVLFNRSLIIGLQLNRLFSLPLPLRIGIAGLISGMIVSFLPTFFYNNAGLRQTLIAGQLDWQTTGLAFVAYFFLTIITYSSGAAGGLFAPTLVLGAALGYLVGEAEVSLINIESTYSFALTGMAAFFTSVVRVPVTAIVIIFEMTADFNLVLPLMITSAVSYITAESISRCSVYQHLLDASGIKLQEENPNYDILSQLKAHDVMQTEVETLASSLTMTEVIKAMSRSHHRGFPVLEKGVLVGIIAQSDLENINQQKKKTLLREVMTKNPITVNPESSIGDVLYLLNRYQLSRLPVTEGNNLVGIITRSDIIKAEAKQLIGGQEATVKPPCSYTTYQTRSPATGRGRILLPLSNPLNVSPLFEIAMAIARYQKYEIECLQVINVPKYSYPAQAQVDTKSNRQLMLRLERQARKAKIPLHTKICVATDTVEAILSTITQEHINLVVMGWKGKTHSSDRIFGSIVDPLIEKAPCELLLVKLGQQPYSLPYNQSRMGKWLIPTAGGTNVQRALKVLPALADLYPRSLSPKIHLCQVYSPHKSPPNLPRLNRIAKLITDKTNLPVFPLPIADSSAPEAIARLVEQEKHDLVVLGASREGLLKQALYGNVPEAIAHKVNCTVMIIRSPAKID